MSMAGGEVCGEGAAAASRKRATPALVAQTERRNGPGRAKASRLKGTVESQGQRGGGAGPARNVTTTEGSSTGEAAGSPEGSQAAGAYGATQALAVPVLQMVEQHVEVLSFLRSSLPAVAEQVIEVPALSLPVCAVQRVVPLEPQMAEQLVEVPTVLSVAVLQQQTVVQAVDVPVPHRGGHRRLQGTLPEQSATASGAEQIVDNSSGGQQDFHLGQGSIASSSAAADEAFSEWVLAIFPGTKKCACRREFECEGAPARQLMDSGSLWGDHRFRRVVPGLRRGARPTIGTDAPTRPPGTLLRASRLSGSARSLQTVGSGLAWGYSCQYLGPPTTSSWLMGLGVRGLASPHPILGAILVLGSVAGPVRGLLYLAVPVPVSYLFCCASVLSAHASTVAACYVSLQRPGEFHAFSA